MDATRLAPPSTSLAEGEIDLREFSATLKRRWAWIASGGAIGLAAAITLNAVSKPVWEGEFQIVLAKKEGAGGAARLLSMAAANPMLAQLAGFGGAAAAGSELDTEVKILKSPLVLLPIFDYVKNQKLLQGKKVKNMRFNGWVKRNLKVKLEKGTSVLNISYRDSERSLVLPVLQRISRAYQSYSGRDRSLSLTNGLNYAREQTNRYRRLADASSRARDAYGIRYGISGQGGSIASAGIDVSKFLGAGNNAGPAVNLSGGSSAPTSLNAKGDPLGQLAAINQELIYLKQLYTDRDPAIQMLQRERDALRLYVESTAGGNLALPGQRPLSKAQAQEVLVRFQELDRAAKRDNATLESLENALLTLELERARATRPWELISNPNLLDKPVSPKPKRNLALGLLAGLVLGTGGALIAERRSGRVFASDELRQLLPYPLLANLTVDDANCLALLAQGPLKAAVQVALLPAGDVPDAERLRANLQQAMQALDPAAQVMLTGDLTAAGRCNAQLVLAAAGAGTPQQLSKLHTNLQLQGRPVAGLLLLDDAA